MTRREYERLVCRIERAEKKVDTLALKGEDRDSFLEAVPVGIVEEAGYSLDDLKDAGDKYAEEAPDELEELIKTIRRQSHESLV